MSIETNKAIVRRFYATKQQDLEAMLVADYVHHDPGLPPEAQRGRDNYRRGVAMFYTAFPDLQEAIEAQVAEGDRVTTRLRWRGTHQGALMGIAPTGKAVDFGMIAIHRLADDKIAEGWVNFDALGLMQQLGVVPTPGHGPT